MARKGLNSGSTLVALAREAGVVVAVPASVSLTPEEMVLWPVFASARAASDWRPLDLILLADAVKLECEIRRCQRDRDEQGALITTPRGVQKAHPLGAVIDMLKRRQLSILRALGLHTQGDSRTTAARAAKARTFAQLADDDDSLLARPWSS